MQPRDYQLKVMEETRAFLRSCKPDGRKPRVVLRLPCGAGKTATAGFISKSTIERGGSAAFLCHRDFLLDQTSQTFEAIGIDHSYIAAGRWFNPWTTCHVGMIGSMKSRMSKIKAPTVCFIDECQSTPARTWKAILDAWKDTIFIGLSATPSHRSDGKGLDDIYDGIIQGPSERYLIETGSLSDYEWFAPTDIDTSAMHTRMGDYVQSETDAEMSKASIVGDIVDSYKKHANGTIAIYFATSIETSKMYAEAFNAAGIPAAHVDAETPAHERSRIAKAMARREILVMTNVMIASAGFDLAAQAGMPVTVETVGLCRPTKSLPLLVQMSMRAMRAKPYKGIILDHVGAYREHNWLPDDDMEWTLSGSEKKTTESAIKQCDNCGAALRRGTLVCSSCGFANIQTKEGAAIERAGPDHIDGELAAINREEIRRQREEAISDMKVKRSQARTLEDLINIEKDMGYRSGWARHIWKSRQGRT